MTRTTPILPKGYALWTPGTLGAALLASQKAKGMESKKPEVDEDNQLKFYVSIRVSRNELLRLNALKDCAGIDRTAYIKKQVFGGRPIVALTDQKMISELRKLGGLLKSNFQTLRQANASKDLLQNQEEILRNIGRLIDKLSLKADDRQKN